MKDSSVYRSSYKLQLVTLIYRDLYNLHYRLTLLRVINMANHCLGQVSVAIRITKVCDSVMHGIPVKLASRQKISGFHSSSNYKLHSNNSITWIATLNKLKIQHSQNFTTVWTVIVYKVFLLSGCLRNSNIKYYRHCA